MEWKVIKFENLYNHEFAVDIVNAWKKRWEPNTYGSHRYWDMNRSRNGILMLHNCCGILELEDGETIKIKKDELLYIPSGLKYRIKLIDCESDYFVYVFDYRMFDIDGNRIICSETPVKLYNGLIGSYISHHEKLCNAMSKIPPFRLKCNTIVYDFLSDIILLYRKDIHDEVKYMNISKAVMHMEKNFTEPISNKILAEMCSVSQDCFIRTFKMYYDTTPRKYILDLRINRAKEMLASQPLTISEISYELGFESPTYFSNMFKKKVGVTPSQYKNHSI